MALLTRKIDTDAATRRKSRQAETARLKELMDQTPLPAELDGLSEEDIARMANDMVMEVRTSDPGAA